MLGRYFLFLLLSFLHIFIYHCICLLLFLPPITYFCLALQIFTAFVFCPFLFLSISFSVYHEFSSFLYSFIFILLFFLSYAIPSFFRFRYYFLSLCLLFQFVWLLFNLLCWYWLWWCYISINITLPLRICFPLLNPTKLHHYHVTFIILMPGNKLESSSSSSPAFVVF
jgi:hypothetical protein